MGLLTDIGRTNAVSQLGDTLMKSATTYAEQGRADEANARQNEVLKMQQQEFQQKQAAFEDDHTPLFGDELREKMGPEVYDSVKPYTDPSMWRKTPDGREFVFKKDAKNFWGTVTKNKDIQSVIGFAKANELNRIADGMSKDLASLSSKIAENKDPNQTPTLQKQAEELTKKIEETRNQAKAMARDAYLLSPEGQKYILEQEVKKDKALESGKPSYHLLEKNSKGEERDTFWDAESKTYKPAPGPSGQWRPSNADTAGFVSDDTTESIVEGIFNGNIDPNFIPKRGEARNKLIKVWMQKHPDESIIDYEAYAKWKKDPQVMRAQTFMASIPPVLDRMMELRRLMGDSGIQEANRIIQGAQAQTGNPDVAEFVTLMRNVTVELPTALTGFQPTEARIKFEVENLKGSQTVEQFDRSAKATKFLIGVRQKEFAAPSWVKADKLREKELSVYNSGQSKREQESENMREKHKEALETKIPSFGSEEEAEAASKAGKIKPGEKIIINGVTGTWR